MASAKTKPILVLDFDGVIHWYRRGWVGPTVVDDEPAPGALEFIVQAQEHFAVAIYSSRSHQEGGREAMRMWLRGHLAQHWPKDKVQDIMDRLQWPDHKPSAFVTIDDRALTFCGIWPSMEELRDFQPWTKRAPKKMISQASYDLCDLENSNLRKCLAHAAKYLTDTQKREIAEMIKRPIQDGGVVEAFDSEEELVEVKRLCVKAAEQLRKLIKFIPDSVPTDISMLCGVAEETASALVEFDPPTTEASLRAITNVREYHGRMKRIAAR